jgi:hypothetical protein
LAKSKSPRGGPALRLAFLRQLHVYIGVFVAPSLLFFALTGALQTFRIPDQKTSPVLIQKLARVHKDDIFAVKPARPKHAEGGQKPAEAKPQRAPEPRSTTALKWFFAAVSLGIMATTLVGIWMALAHNRRRAVTWLVLAVGAAAPVLIVLLL